MYVLGYIKGRFAAKYRFCPQGRGGKYYRKRRKIAARRPKIQTRPTDREKPLKLTKSVVTP
jgi:hypothetical protein